MSRWLAVLLLAMAPTTAAAQDGTAAVRLDGRTLFRVAATDSQSAARRAGMVEQRLAALVTAPSLPGATTVAADSLGQPAVLLGGRAIVTVTPDDAAAQLRPADSLAMAWAEATDRELGAARARRASRAGDVGAGVEGAVRGSAARLGESVRTIVPRALAAFLVLGLTWLVAAALRRLLRVAFRHLIADRTIENLIRQVTYYAVWLIGFAVAVDALGFRPQTVITGLGLTGLALGFALKDIISNFVSGILLLVLRPFELGDEIVIGDTEGRVERIELRATQIRTYDGRVVLVPNAEIFTNRVTNNTAAAMRRGSVECHVGYGDDLRTVVEALLRASRRTEGVLEAPAPDVRVRALAADGVRVESRFWTDSRQSDLLATEHKVRLATVAEFRAAGVEDRKSVV